MAVGGIGVSVAVGTGVPVHPNNSVVVINKTIVLIIKFLLFMVSPRHDIFSKELHTKYRIVDHTLLHRRRYASITVMQATPLPCHRPVYWH